MALSDQITAKLKELDLAPFAAAEKFGIAYPSFSAVIAGKSLPNARTFKKYGKLLGVAPGDVKALVEAAKGKTKKTGAKKATGKRRGRPPGSKNKVKRGRPARGGSFAQGLAEAVKVVAEAESVLADDLAMSVYTAPKSLRRVVEALMATR